MNWNKPRGLFFAGVATLLVIVALLAFGEQARHGRYHLDGGRGWDLPATTSIDFAYLHFHSAIRPKVLIVIDRHTIPTKDRVFPAQVPFFPHTTLTVGVKRRPPPEV